MGTIAAALPAFFVSAPVGMVATIIASIVWVILQSLPCPVCGFAFEDGEELQPVRYGQRRRAG